MNCYKQYSHRELDGTIHLFYLYNGIVKRKEITRLPTKKEIRISCYCGKYVHHSPSNNAILRFLIRKNYWELGNSLETEDNFNS